MPQELVTILWSVLGMVVTGFVSWGMATLTKWLNSKIKMADENKLLTFAVDAVGDAVKEVFQVFVESMKKEGTFTEDAQKEAKQRAINLVKKQLLPEVVEYITKKFGDLDTWLDSKIESTIYDLKQTDRK